MIKPNGHNHLLDESPKKTIQNVIGLLAVIEASLSQPEFDEYDCPPGYHSGLTLLVTTCVEALYDTIERSNP